MERRWRAKTADAWSSAAMATVMPCLKRSLSGRVMKSRSRRLPSLKPKAMDLRVVHQLAKSPAANWWGSYVNLPMRRCQIRGSIGRRLAAGPLV